MAFPATRSGITVMESRFLFARGRGNCSGAVIDWSIGYGFEVNDKRVPVTSGLIRTGGRKVYDHPRHVRTILPKPNSTHWRRDARNDGLLHSHPRAGKIQNEPVRILHPHGARLQTALAFHSHACSLRSL